MEFELSKGALRAVAESFGGELVSLKKDGEEYIWHGDAAYWSGRNPVLFPNVGRLNGGVTEIDGKKYEMAQHGFARKCDFSVFDRGEDFIEFELRESEETLARYPFAFSLRIRHELTDGGFSTTYRVENKGDIAMPFCIGAHTAFSCGNVEDYELIFSEKETAPTMLLTAEGLISPTATEPWLVDSDRFAPVYADFARLDTVIFEGLRSNSVRLRHRESGRGVRVDYEGFPMLAFWTPGEKRAPFLCIEPWQGCAAVEGEGEKFTDKRHCVVLDAGESRSFTYKITVL